MNLAGLLTPFMVAVGGAIGSLLRYLCSGLMARTVGETFPWGTFTVNVIGSFLIGFVAVTTGPDGRFLWPSYLRAHVMVGIFGGFTTFSSFSLQTLNLAQDGEWLAAGFNIVASLVICLVACWAGHAVGVWVNR